VAGMLLLNRGDPGARPELPPEGNQPDLNVAWNFERFDGIDQPPLEAPAGVVAGNPLGASYGDTPRPGALNQPHGQVYTPGAVTGVVGTLGGQPLPVADWRYHHGEATLTRAPGVQFRQGVGQRGPSELGAAQTTMLAGITNNPPQPGDLSSIIAGLG
jgi:hypothetical protein